MVENRCDVPAVIMWENQIIEEGTNEVRTSSGNDQWKEGACQVCCHGFHLGDEDKLWWGSSTVETTVSAGQKEIEIRVPVLQRCRAKWSTG